jgi:hypothetical protein
MAIKKKMQDGGKAKPMTGEIGAYKKLKGKDLELEKSRYKTFGDAAGSGPSTSKVNYGPLGTGKPKMQMGGDMKKSKDNSSFAKLAPPYDKATYADKIAGATQGKAKSGAALKKQAATAIAMKKAGVKPKAMMKKGGTMKKCKSGCY